LLAFPTRIAEDVPDDFNDWIIIDEIQKAPKLLDEVHRLINQEMVMIVIIRH